MKNLKKQTHKKKSKKYKSKGRYIQYMQYSKYYNTKNWDFNINLCLYSLDDTKVQKALDNKSYQDYLRKMKQ